jgi:hypothetical protein
MKLLGKVKLPPQGGIRDGFIVLYGDYNDATPWVTWWEAEKPLATNCPIDRCHGHYHSDETEAWHDFFQRCAEKLRIKLS